MSVPRLPAESSDAHLDRPTWTNPGDWGARHISDIAPFTLWDPVARQYRMPKNPEYEWCKEKFGDGTLMQPGWFTAISSSSPPNPAPLTLGGMPLIFHPPGEDPWRYLMPRLYYANPRVPNPCPEVKWGEMTFPTKEQNAAILRALEPLAAVQKVVYMPYWSVAELKVRDGREYKPGSLPGVVGGRTMLYHHAEESFCASMPRIMECPRLRGARSGSWFEVGGEGGVALLVFGEVYVKPRPPMGGGGEVVGFEEWEVRSLCAVFGDVREDMRVRAIVRCETGEVVGGFDVVDGVVECVAGGWDWEDGEGWVVV
ncbi:hypothetical protein V499_04986 [Pseudogymnoascus sp. VKM F-103]|nr:hypothetical protein V499_04986 [Pseudogymnoascus sp. VKM F-103]